MNKAKESVSATSHTEVLAPGDCYLDERQASRIDGLSVAWHQRKRWDGSGPPYRRIGRTVRYRLSELIGWLEERSVRSTSDLEKRFKVKGTGAIKGTPSQ